MRIAFTGGPIESGGGVPGMGRLRLEELLRQGVEVDLYRAADAASSPAPIDPQPGLRVIVRRSSWNWGRWYSKTKTLALFTGLIARAMTAASLNVRLLVEHR